MDISETFGPLVKGSSAKLFLNGALKPEEAGKLITGKNLHCPFLIFTSYISDEHCYQTARLTPLSSVSHGSTTLTCSCVLNKGFLWTTNRVWNRGMWLETMGIQGLGIRITSGRPRRRQCCEIFFAACTDRPSRPAERRWEYKMMLRLLECSEVRSLPQFEFLWELCTQATHGESKLFSVLP